VIRRVIPALALVALLAPPAHAQRKEYERLQLQIANMQGQIIALQRSMEDAVTELRRLNQNLANQGDSQRRSEEDQRIQSESTQAALRDVVDGLGEVSEALRALRDSGGGLPPPMPGDRRADGDGDGSAPAPGSSVAGAPPPRELYSQAYADFARGNFDLAVQGFETYLEYYPETEFSDNARYWIGECYYGQQRFDQAIDAWNQLLRDFASSDKVPDARVKKGMALERLGRRSQALLEYRYVLDRYPNSPAARIAREKLNPQS
jgi:tol-pal system protein YbgF